MKLVIDIPEETVNAIKDNVLFGVIPSEILWDVTSAITNGTPLPKGHGRLIDKDALIGNIHGVKSIVAVLDAPTIIEADKAESEDKE